MAMVITSAQGNGFRSRWSSADQSFIINFSAANWASASDTKSSGVTTLRTLSPPIQWFYFIAAIYPTNATYSIHISVAYFLAILRTAFL
jgi:hypothetical protein